MAQDAAPSDTASHIAEEVPDQEGDAAATTFCSNCPNWIELQFESRIPLYMSELMAIAGLSASDIPIEEAGMRYVVRDAQQEVFERTGVVAGNGFARMELPSDIQEVQFAFESERPDDLLGVPEGEQPGDRASDEHWAVDMGRGALTGLELGINGLMRAADDFGFWVGWNPGWVDVDGELIWMSTEERLEFFETYGRPEFMDSGLARPGGTAGQLTEGVTQFLVGFIPAVRAVRLVGASTVVGQTGTYMAAGAIADATVFDPHEQRLANLIQQYPQLRNPVAEFLASDPSDTAAEGRLKNALEGLLFGAVLDRFVSGLRVMRSGMNRMVVILRTQARYVFHSESLKTVVDVLVQAARVVEVRVTPMLEDLAVRYDGRMVGLDFRLKSEESLSRKISQEVIAEPGQYYSQVAARIKDVLRYTIIFPDNAYAAGVQAARDDLIGQGFREVKFKNTWGGTGYQGINANYQTTDGFVFELQFHTNASHAAKEEGTHTLYEQWRVLDPNSEQAREIQRQMNTVFAAVPVPPGSTTLR